MREIFNQMAQDNDSGLTDKIKQILPPSLAIKYISNDNDRPEIIIDRDYKQPYRWEQVENDPIVRYLNSAYDLKTDVKGKEYQLSRYTVAKAIDAFDTGGYTGSWGPEGKMAMLHEKEIVLNKEDTSNLLESISLLRSILTTIDLQAANA
jgi:hypothetical protein